jgi:hypothetical protein
MMPSQAERMSMGLVLESQLIAIGVCCYFLIVKRCVASIDARREVSMFASRARPLLMDMSTALSTGSYCRVSVYSLPRATARMVSSNGSQHKVHMISGRGLYRLRGNEQVTLRAQIRFVPLFTVARRQGRRRIRRLGLSGIRPIERSRNSWLRVPGLHESALVVRETFAHER